MAKEEHKSRDVAVHNHLQKISSEIDNLENKEVRMLESLQATLNEHQKLAALSSVTSFRVDSARSLA